MATSSPLAATAITPSPDVLGASAPRPGTSRAIEPWAVQLADGQVCQLVEAAWAGLGPYSCRGLAAGNGQPDGPGARAADCHVPDSAQPRWTALCQVNETPARSAKRLSPLPGFETAPPSGTKWRSSRRGPRGLPRTGRLSIRTRDL
jgi:hypothetical protein